MNHRYFKLVATFEGREQWVTDEFLDGRARYGWSPPGANLTGLSNNPRGYEQWPEEDWWAWPYSKFLVNRLQIGDRIVAQTSRPIREFLIGEIVDPGYSFDGEQEDFNHILNIRPLVRAPISVNAKAVPEFLKHDLSKRGRYYEIYPERSKEALDELVNIVSEGSEDLTAVRTKQDTSDKARESAKSRLVEVIRNSWPAAKFEEFCADLLGNLPYVQVKEKPDRGKGWDMLVQFFSPITGEILLDEVPVQCKNYSGPVRDQRPIHDLVRSVKNLKNSSLALLLIMGDLTDEFNRKLSDAAARTSRELDRDIAFQVVDQDRIAELYASTMLANDTSGSDVSPE